MAVTASSRLLVGRKIVAFRLNPFPDGRGGMSCNPTITLDNGARLCFLVEETESDYGIRPIYLRKE